MGKNYFVAGASFFIWFALLAGQGMAQLPPAGVQGYTVSMQNDWVVGSVGARPLRISIQRSPAKTLAEDQKFSIRLTSTFYDRPDIVASTPLTIESGKNSGAVELYIAKHGQSFPYQIELLIERGEPDPRTPRNDLLYTSLGNMTLGNRNAWNTSNEQILLISSQFSSPQTYQWLCYRQKGRNETKELGTTIPLSCPANAKFPSIEAKEIQLGQTLGDARASNSILTLINTSDQVAGVHPDFLPRRWTGLSSTTTILISAQDLQDISSTNDQTRGNLEKWVAVGGTLIVFDTGQQFKKARQIRRQLVSDSRQIGVSRTETTWRWPDPKLGTFSELVGVAPEQQYWQSPTNSRIYETKILQQQGKLWKYTSDLGSVGPASKFVISDFVSGKIVAVADDMSQWRTRDWRNLHNAVAVSNSSIVKNIGGETASQSNIFFNIPGIGEPPVGMFQISIGMFLFLAGPVMVWMLRRHRQMQLMFVAVPILSLAVCGVLFFYAIIIDGSQRWGRTETYTRLDQQVAMATTHARCTYYSGSSPGSYSFDRDTHAMTPCKDSTRSLLNQFDDDSTLFSGGDIRVRTPHQVVTVRPSETNLGLVRVKQKSADSKSAPAIKNRLGANIEILVFKTEQGLFVINDLAVDQTAEGEEVKMNAAALSISQLIGKLSPLDNPRSGNTNTYNYDYLESTTVSNSQWGVDVTVGRKLRRRRLSRFLDRPNSYIAILKEFPHASQQIEPVNYKTQLHIVHGQW